AHNYDRSRRSRLLVFRLRFFRWRRTRAFAWLLLRVLPLAPLTVVIVVAGSRIVLAAAEPIEHAARLRAGPLSVVLVLLSVVLGLLSVVVVVLSVVLVLLSVVLVLLVPVPKKLGLRCHAGRLG